MGGRLLFDGVGKIGMDLAGVLALMLLCCSPSCRFVFHLLCELGSLLCLCMVRFTETIKTLCRPLTYLMPRSFGILVLTAV